jgi:cell volume regulation protein A
MMTYGIVASLGGSGFLAVYIAGLVFGNSKFGHRNSRVRFHEGIAWLMQIAMFLTLGLLVFPSHLVAIAGVGILFSLFLLFVARPVAVFLSLAPWKMALREKVMVSWVGLRGAVPIVLATFPLIAGIPQAGTIFNVVFFIVITSALLHGTSIPFVARKLGVSAPMEETPRLATSLGDGCESGNDLIELTVPPEAAIIGKQIVDIGLPSGTLIIMIEKGKTRFVPCGSTILEQGDRLLILTNQPQSDQVRSIVFAPGPRIAEDPGSHQDQKA